LQIFDDQQTQTLPDDELNQQRLNFLLGHIDFSHTLDEINNIMAAVHSEFELVIGYDSEPDDPCESAFVSAWEHNDVSLLSEADDSWQQPLSDFR
ncbi:hypothetical protein ACKI1O_48600, partial [Streptomyces scabiei]